MLVSVVIVTRNRPDFLRKSLQSVINQTYNNIEIIIIDDNSNDNIQRVINSFLELHSNILYFKNKKTMGANFSRNFGFKLAKGFFVAFLDDDDFWKENKIYEQVNYFNISNFDIISCNFEYRKYFQNFKSNISNYISLNKLLDSNYLGGVSGILIKKSSFDINIFDNKFPSCQDWDFWIRNLLDKKKIIILQSNLYKYTVHSNNKITNNLNNSYKGRLLFFLKYRRNFDADLRKKKIYELLIIRNIINDKFISFLNLIISSKTGMKYRLRLSYIKKYIIKKIV